MSQKEKPPARQRLDKFLVEQGFAKSREHARGLIMSGDVLVDDNKVDKPGHQVRPEAAIRILAEPPKYVSRGGEKLEGALQHWKLDPTGMRIIDIGVSTGGFSDCLLQKGASHITGIDVGYGQAAFSLRTDERVTLFERTNIRKFDETSIEQKADLCVIDVSFISLTLVLEKAKNLLRSGGTILALVKPQFEVGKGEVGKGGVVRDPEKHAACITKIEEFAASIGLEPQGSTPSPIQGPKGNREFFVRLYRP